MAAKLRELRRRKTSVVSTMKITRAMELVAASRIVRAQQGLLRARPYAERIAQAIQGLAGISEIATEFPLLTERERIRTVGLLLITSDRGLAGAYNANVIRVAETLIRDARKTGQGYRLHIVGRKGVSFFRFRRYEIASETTGISDQPRFQDAEVIGDRLTAEFIDGKVDRVVICFTDFRSAAVQRAGWTQVLPISRQEVERPAGWVPPLYDFEPSADQILSHLLPRYVNTVVFAGLLESAASEHAARRRAMKAATENAKDLIGALDRVINRERQTEITTEILEVVGGAEALTKMAKEKIGTGA